MRKITYQQLVRLNACTDQLEVFKRLFGEEVTPTVALAKKYGHLLQATWCANKLLPPPLRKQYLDSVAPLRKQYWDSRAPLEKQYLDSKALLEKQYRDSVVPLRKQYEDSVAPLRKQYDASEAPLWKQYKQQCMVEFVKLYQQENEHV